MIADLDRKWWFGASDSYKVITPNHNTKTWQTWWRVKCGIEEPNFVGNKYTEAGTRFEHPILECFDKSINMDRQLIYEDLRLRVNYDGDKNGVIYEVKTHKAENPFEITPYIEAQIQTEMYVWKQCRDDFRGLYILSYAMTDEDYENMNPTVEDIDFDRIKVHERKYKRRQVKHFIGCLKPLVEELRQYIKEEHSGEENEEYIHKRGEVPCNGGDDES